MRLEKGGRREEAREQCHRLDGEDTLKGMICNPPQPPYTQHQCMADDWVRAGHSRETTVFVTVSNCPGKGGPLLDTNGTQHLGGLNEHKINLGSKTPLLPGA